MKINSAVCVAPPNSSEESTLEKNTIAMDVRKKSMNLEWIIGNPVRR